MNDWLIFGVSVITPALVLFIGLVWRDLNKRKPRRRY